MSHIAIDLQRLYNKYFGQPYLIKNTPPAAGEGDGYRVSMDARLEKTISTAKGSSVKTEFEGKPVWLPVTLCDLDALKQENGTRTFGFERLLLPYCTIAITGKKTIVRTPLSQRRGTVKELYSVEDYEIDIKGFVINKERNFPEEEITILKHIFESRQSIGLDNALTNIFLTDESVFSKTNTSCRAAVVSLDFPQTSGESVWIRPFSMKCESDSVFDLVQESP